MILDEEQGLGDSLPNQDNAPTASTQPPSGPPGPGPTDDTKEDPTLKLVIQPFWPTHPSEYEVRLQQLAQALADPARKYNAGFAVALTSLTQIASEARNPTALFHLKNMLATLKAMRDQAAAGVAMVNIAIDHPLVRQHSAEPAPATTAGPKAKFIRLHNGHTSHTVTVFTATSQRISRTTTSTVNTNNTCNHD